MKKKETIVVNIIGGPGVGKSILTSDVFSALKREGISCDIAAEYIKKKLREKALKAVESQIYIFAKQQFQLFTLKDEVDVIVTDSPIFFSAVYDKTKCPLLRALIMKEFHKYNTINYLVERDETQAYEEEGRYQNLDGAKKVDTQMVKFLAEENIEYTTVYGIGPKTIKNIVHDVLAELKRDDTKKA
jgi:nicotinamide riboside kinase